MCIRVVQEDCLRRSGMIDEMTKSEALSVMDRAFVDSVGRGHDPADQLRCLPWLEKW